MSFQNPVVSGQVTDATTGEFLPGVSIVVEGKPSVGSMTDISGNYSINLPSDSAVLIFSFIGYMSERIKVDRQTKIDVKLAADIKMLTEVVVVGYGSRKKETLTGAISTVNAKSFEDKGSLASPLQAMQGQVPGVIITRSSAAPGDESWSVKLRGSVSSNSTEPLVVVDGVAMDSYKDLRLINTADIENMSFLKDGAAAIYGSRAAGGVILVTTKKGKGDKTIVEYDASFSRKIVGLQPRLMNLTEWANGVIEARTNDGYGSDDMWIRYANLAKANLGGYINLETNANPITNFGDIVDYVFLDNNWTDILWGDANSSQHNLSLSGSSGKSNYRLSFGYLEDDGTLKWGNNNNKRYNARLSNSFHLSDRFTVESVIAYNRQNQVSPTQISSVLGQGYPQPGLPVSTLTGKPYTWGGQRTPNWYAELGGDNKLLVSALNISENLNFKIFDELHFIANLGYNTSYAGRDIQQNSIQWYNYVGDLEIAKYPTQANSYFQKSTATSNFYSASAYLQYNKKLQIHHDLGFTLGTQYERNEYDYSYAKVLDINSTLSILEGSGTATTSATKNHYAMGSYFARANYDFKSKYLLEANGRYDGSSKFAAENRWKFFYGISAGWRITQEGIMKDLGISDFLNELKLRASYGVVGNQNGIDMYDGQQLLEMTTGTGAYLGSSKVSYVTTSGTMVSYNRTWEKIDNYNLALDFSLLKNKLSGTVEWFKKNNNNMLLSQTYAGVLGADAPDANIGKFEANGWEGTISWSDHINSNLKYRLGGTITYANNKLTDFGGNDVISQGYNSAVEGHPLNSIFGLEYAGRIQTETQRQEYLDKYLVGNSIGLTSAIRVGDNMFKDMNKDGTIDQKDLVYLGTDDPKISYSFNAGMEWNGMERF